MDVEDAAGAPETSVHVTCIISEERHFRCPS